ncbi:peptide deformylase [Arenibacter sp. GZD96]|uniref:peptide deformylase n=1 Tax=Aurantibrevibacter litoralis TaxID=3106030 RepID=UPI002AFE9496|nr:peptide deformylase [Arenibacter sp. GZD-96]MEA1785287.1 peptide deformylase [Arenibacter sp. GZD-96]
MKQKSITLFYVALLMLAIIGCSGGQKVQNPHFESNFTAAQMEMIMAGDSSQPMRVFKINKASDSILLRTKSEPVIVNPKDPVLTHFIKRLFATVRDSMSLGVGIAAPQVGILKNIIWVQRFDKEHMPFEVYLNPKIVQYSKMTQDCLEGCLSIPDRRDTTKTRAYALLLEYDTLENTQVTEMVEAFTAVIFQHEIDHLNGILYLDHLEKEVKGSAHQ